MCGRARDIESVGECEVVGERESVIERESVGERVLERVWESV